MAKKQAEENGAGEIGVVRHPETREVISLVLPNPEPKTMGEVAENYFAEHEQYTLNEVIVAPDFTVFPGSPKGQNAADNYCMAKGLGAPQKVARK